jgi:hypothetical protein
MSTSISESNRRLPLHRRFLFAMPAFVDPQPGRHRFEEGTVCPDTEQVTGATPCQFRAKHVIRRNGGDVDVIRVRRAR